MARRNVSQNESSNGPPLFDTLMLAGFLAGFSVFLAVVTCQSPELAEPPLAVENAVVPEEPQTTIRSVAPGLSLKAIKNLQPRHFRTEPVSFPVVSKVNAEQSIMSFAPAAVAEKPKTSLGVASGPQITLSKPLPKTELQLEEDLVELVPTVGLDLAKAEALVNTMQTRPPAIANATTRTRPTETVLAFLSEDLISSLPFAEKTDCTLEFPLARHLETYSKHVHEQITKADDSVKRRYPSSSASRRDAMVARTLGQDRKCQSPEAVRALQQILQVETATVRQEYVKLLSDNHTLESTKALANRAVFDLSPEVRRDARQALRERSRREYREDLLEALRYPWAPAAWHAAETLVAVQDKTAVPALIELLDAPEPTMPFPDRTGKLVVRELVRLNHSQNCLVCHAPSRDEKDPVRGFVPLPRSAAYYADRSTGVVVRADVTYLRQDFSVVHDVDKSQSRPNRQRFDYLVRTREATPQEQLLAYGKAHSPADAPSYPQREAVLYALRKLTGQNPGLLAQDWRRSQQLLAESW